MSFWSLLQSQWDLGQAGPGRWNVGNVGSYCGSPERGLRAGFENVDMPTIGRML